MVIFFEGIRSKGKLVEEFKVGSFKFVIKLKCLIILLIINGIYKLLEGNNNRVKSVSIEFVIYFLIYVILLNKDELEVLFEIVYLIVNSSYKNY